LAKKVKETPQPERRRIPLADLTIDEEVRSCVPAAMLSKEVIHEAERDPRPVTVYEGEDGIVLAAGHAQYEARRRAGVPDIECVVLPGSKRDAIVATCGIDTDQRTDLEKRIVATKFLTDAEWCHWSDTKIAKNHRVNQAFVSRLRRRLKAEGNANAIAGSHASKKFSNTPRPAATAFICT
jgi:hypothetical protein